MESLQPFIINNNSCLSHIVPRDSCSSSCSRSGTQVNYQFSSNSQQNNAAFCASFKPPLRHTFVHVGSLGTSEVLGSEEDENLLDVSLDTLHFFADDIEAYSLRDGSALTDSHNITILQTEGWRAVSRDSLVALLKSIVLLDVMQVITTKYNSPVHLS